MDELRAKIEADKNTLSRAEQIRDEFSEKIKFLTKENTALRDLLQSIRRGENNHSAVFENNVASPKLEELFSRLVVTFETLVNDTNMRVTALENKA